MNPPRRFAPRQLASALGVAVVFWFTLAATARVHAATEPTGTEKPAAGSPQGGKDPGAVVLPEYEANGLRPWCYVEFPGYEILSLVNPSETEQYARRLRFEQVFFALFLPPSSRHPPAHTAFSVILESPAFQELRGKSTRPYWLKYATPIRAGDDRSFMLLADWETRDGRAKSPEARRMREVGSRRFSNQFALQFSVLRRVHFELPEWYWQGLMELAHSALPIPGDRLRFGGYTLCETTLHAGGDVRLPAAVDGAAPLPLYPLERLFTLRKSDFVRVEPAPARQRERDLYEDQCGLFLRWACWADGGSHREALLRFASEAGRDAPTAERFRECFGLDFAAADRVFAQFVAAEIRPALEEFRDATRARTKRFRIRSSEEEVDRVTDERLRRDNPQGIFLLIPNEHQLPLPADLAGEIFAPLIARKATRAEVTRIVGETYLWSASNERLTGAAISPTLTRYTRPETERNDFLSIARRKLRGGQEDKGARDPQSLAALAFLERRDRHDATARELLEAAVAARVARPAVYTTLADMELDEAAKHARANPAEAAARVRRARELIDEALRQFPEMPAAHELLARGWRASGETPPPEVLARLFCFARSENTALSAVVTIAELHRRARLPERATELARLYLARQQRATDPRLEKQIEQLAGLASP